MTLNELNEYFNNILHNECFENDIAKNGVQIQNSAPDSKQIKKVAFAVDACVATVKKAAELGADLLFTHHGLFWGGCQTVTGPHYERIAEFIRNDIALYASHIPLDANPVVGNNYGLAARLGLKNLQPFGQWRGMTLGVKGELPQELTVEQLARKVLDGAKPARILDFGKKTVRTVGIVSGGASEDHVSAAIEGLDAFVTGEVGHEDYHSAEELKINFIAGGHYCTETVGVNLMRRKLEAETGIETVFIDIPTGL